MAKVPIAVDFHDSTACDPRSGLGLGSFGAMAFWFLDAVMA